MRWLIVLPLLAMSAPAGAKDIDRNALCRVVERDAWAAYKTVITMDDGQKRAFDDEDFPVAVKIGDHREGAKQRLLLNLQLQRELGCTAER